MTTLEPAQKLRFYRAGLTVRPGDALTRIRHSELAGFYRPVPANGDL
jgi:hypothetical protein